MTRSEWITVAIVDDEPLGRQRVRQLLKRHPDCHVIGEAATAGRAEALLASQRPDVTFLDVRLPDADGFDLLSRLGSRYTGHTIFVTAHDEHAVRAFDTKAIDYLLKPLERERFNRAVERARQMHAIEGGAHRAAANTLRPRRLAVSSGDGIVRLIPIKQIDWIEAAGNYIRIHAGSIHETFRDSLASVERRLDDRYFVRIHRSSIINIDRLSHLEPNGYGDYVLTLQDGTQLPFSRRYSTRIDLLLGHL